MMRPGIGTLYNTYSKYTSHRPVGLKGANRPVFTYLSSQRSASQFFGARGFLKNALLYCGVVFLGF